MLLFSLFILLLSILILTIITIIINVVVIATIYYKFTIITVIKNKVIVLFILPVSTLTSLPVPHPPQVMVATVRCEEIAAEKLQELKQSEVPPPHPPTPHLDKLIIIFSSYFF